MKREVQINRDTDLLKLVAMITMLIDHIGVVFFPGVTEFRIIGRIAFPIYCYTLAAGCCYSRDMRRYALRLAAFALIAQPFYALTLNHVNSHMTAALAGGITPQGLVMWYLNAFRTCSIMVPLLLGQLIIWTLKDERYILTALLTFFVMWLDKAGYISTSYGYRGITLMVLFYLFIDKPAASFVWVALFMTWWGTRSTSYDFYGFKYGIQFYAVLALPFIYLPIRKRYVRLPKAVGYLFYPLHLAVLYAVSIFLG